METELFHFNNEDFIITAFNRILRIENDTIVRSKTFNWMYFRISDNSIEVGKDNFESAEEAIEYAKVVIQNC